MTTHIPLVVSPSKSQDAKCIVRVYGTNSLGRSRTGHAVQSGVLVSLVGRWWKNTNALMHDSAICHKPQQYRATCPLEKAHHACMFFVAIIVALTTILVSLCGQRVSIAVPHFCAANGLPYLGFQTSWQNQKRKTMSREFLSRERKRNPNRKWK